MNLFRSPLRTVNRALRDLGVAEGSTTDAAIATLSRRRGKPIKVTDAPDIPGLPSGVLVVTASFDWIVIQRVPSYDTSSSPVEPLAADHVGSSLSFPDVVKTWHELGHLVFDDPHTILDVDEADTTKLCTERNLERGLNRRSYTDTTEIRAELFATRAAALVTTSPPTPDPHVPTEVTQALARFAEALGG